MDSLWQWLFLLLFFILLIVAFWFLGKYGRRWLRNFRVPAQGKQLKVLDAVSLDFRTRLFLVSVTDRQKVLVADNGNHIRVMLMPNDEREADTDQQGSAFEKILKDADSNTTD
ncbi:MAG TPA: FliO/MopB family protein [Coprothermobacter sp.]|nr:FliO/MopB family protein [Coprothermobacter sp.]